MLKNHLMRYFWFSLFGFLGPIQAVQIQPGDSFDYAKQAFYPERWQKAGLNQNMVPWEGKHVVLVTSQGSDLDPGVMAGFVDRLDAAWHLYHELTGYTPRVFKNYKGKATIVALPADHLSCGYGCGYVGSTGIEMTRFYEDHYPALKKNPKSIPHCYFYEMGRNYYGFGARHDAFTTGFAVFMRYVCMDSLGYHDSDQRVARVIREAIDLWEKSEMSFLAGFTSHAGTGEKGHRLFNKDGQPIRPSDQNVLYASLLLKLRAEYGGNEFVKRFYRQVFDCPRVRAENRESAQRQCLGLLVSASIAARKDLSPLFCESYRLELPKKVRKFLATVQWEKDGLMASQVMAKIEQNDED